MLNHEYLHPGLILIVFGILVLLLPERIRKWGVLFGSAAAFAAALYLDPSASMSYVFSQDITCELMKVDGTAQIFCLIFTVIAVITAVYSFDNGPGLEKCASMIYAGASVSVVLSGDWISLVAFWELMAASSCYLVFAGKTHQAKRASYRYMVMHFFGGNMLLAGVLFMCMKGNVEVGLVTGETGWCFWLLFLGVAVNGAIPPLHTWVADAYPEATPSGTVYMGSYTTKVAIYAMIRMFAGTEWLITVGAVMAVFAACMALIENDLRRLLSYHIVSQLGMMVAALGTGFAVGIDGAALHAAYNILYKGVLLMGAGAIFYATGKRKITELSGMAKKMPLVSVCFLIASLAIAGMPPLNGFASKALIMEALHEGHFTLEYWLIMIAGVGTWLSITLKINYFVFFKKSEEGFDVKCRKVPAHMMIAMVCGTVLCIVTGIFPDYFYALTPYGSAVHLFGAEHVLEYVGMFIGATVPFVTMISKMAPHDMLTVDFDWFYRRPLAGLVFGISRAVCHFFDNFAERGSRLGAVVHQFFSYPKFFFDMITEKEDEETTPIGSFMVIFFAFCIIGLMIALAIAL